jgi:molybdopterin-guanine dinucleotide biosynthesis adapter protein
VRDPNQLLRNEVHGVIAVATDLDIAGDYVFRLDESQEIAAFIRKRFLKDGEQPREKASLLINGNKVPLKGFVQDALAGTVAGFVKSLKFSDDASEIELRIKLGRPAVKP